MNKYGKGRGFLVTWDELVIGQVYGPHQFHVSEDVLRKYLSAVQDKNIFYYLENQCCPPTMAALYFGPILSNIPAEGRIHAKQQFCFHMPAKIGDTLHTTMTVSNKYIKREKKYVDLSMRTEKSDGELVVSGVSALIWPC